MKRFICVGDLVLDIYYDENLKYIGCDGGISAFNIICNLRSMGFPSKAYGVCGNDDYGRIAIKSLKDCNVETDITVNDKIKTNAYQIRKVIENGKYCFRSIRHCPFCDERTWYDGSYIDEKKIVKKIDKEDIIVFDNLNNKNQYIIDNTDNIKLLDLGQYREFEDLDSKEILNKLKNKFTIINLNQRVEKFLLEKMNLNSDVELLNILEVKLLIITRGVDGCSIVYKNKVYDYPLKEISEEVDDSGAGDIFFSTIIKNWANNNYGFNSKYFSSWIEEASLNASKIVKVIGSRSLIKKMYTKPLIKNCKCSKIDN